ncbi:MAG: hypothetical protein ACI9U2_005027 [Bradymonadia bacterium]|jgi:hypothetical protein
MHRIALILCLTGVSILACGGGGNRGVAPLVDGTGLFLLRYNPPGCLASRPELHVEVKTPQGWERVALDPPADDDVDLVSPLMARFEGDPHAQVRIEARFTTGIVTFVGGHASRILRVLTLDPPAEEAL